MSMESKRQAQAAIRQNLYFFVLRVLDQLYRDDLASHQIRYLEAMCRAMQDVLEGKTPRLIITIPPRHLKSTCAAVALPAFVLGRNPNWEIMVVSYGDDLLRMHSDHFRQIIGSNWYKEIFPNMQIRKGQDRADEIVTMRGGRRKAVSIQGGITGRGANLVIMDDMMKADDIHSDTKREQVKQVYRETIRSRQNDQRNPREIVLQQRLGVDDFAGYLMGTGTFRHFNLPLVAEEQQSFELYYDRTYEREPGAILNPDTMSSKEIEDLRATAGEQVFQCQYQQNPDVVGNSSVRFDEIATCEEIPERKYCGFVIQSWDPAFVKSASSDYAVCTTWGFLNNKWYLLDIYRKRMDFVDLKGKVISMRNQWSADRVIIEADGSGRAVAQQLHKDGCKWVKAVNAGNKNKELRLIDQAARLVSGDYILPRNAPWFRELRREFMAFPDGNHDDQVDSISQFIAWINSNNGRGFLNKDPATGRRRKGRRPSRRRSYNN